MLWPIFGSAIFLGRGEFKKWRWCWNKNRTRNIDVWGTPARSVKTALRPHTGGKQKTGRTWSWTNCD